MYMLGKVMKSGHNGGTAKLVGVAGRHDWL